MFKNMKIYQKFLLPLVCLIFSSCGSDSPQNENSATVSASPAALSSPSPMMAADSSPSQTVVPLKEPARVASGAITESGGGWNEAVRRVTYQTSADNSQQPAMFYAPKTGEPRPLLVGLHSWS